MRWRQQHDTTRQSKKKQQLKTRREAKATWHMLTVTSKWQHNYSLHHQLSGRNAELCLAVSLQTDYPTVISMRNPYKNCILRDWVASVTELSLNVCSTGTFFSANLSQPGCRSSCLGNFIAAEPMNPSFKFLTALQSGQQTRGALRSTGWNPKGLLLSLKSDIGLDNMRT